ncbi:MAG TPA: Holliday junction resolvase RuvX, partial [Gammaproteobacteria bacterium]|nr:Holliday junction resolvase RuvX [Gammaproteobacteria bacterium]
GEMPSTVRVLGFDYGQKRIGVAIGQSVTQTASPLTTLPATNGIPDWQTLQEIIDKWKPDFCIVGIPYNPEGSESTQQNAQRFANQLHEHTQLPVLRIDEHLSTVSAKERLRAQNKIPNKTNVNAMAAAIILESWFQDKDEKKDPF